VSLSPERIAELREYASMNTGDLSRTITLGDLAYLLAAADEADHRRREIEDYRSTTVRLRARVARLESALRTVRWGCATAEEQAAARYGASWRNEVIDAALAGGES